MGEREGVLTETGASSGCHIQKCQMGSSFLTVGTLAGLLGPKAMAMPEWV